MKQVGENIILMQDLAHQKEDDVQEVDNRIRNEHSTLSFS